MTALARLRAAALYLARILVALVILILAYADVQRADEEADQAIAEILRPAPDTKFTTEKEMR